MTLRPSARSRAKQRTRRAEPGRAEWKAIRSGRCGVCGRRGKVVRHHVIYEQHVRRAGGDPWDLANSFDVGVFCSCHELHHASGPRRRPIPLGKLPDEAVAFAVDLMGEDRAVDYFRRYYLADLRGVGTYAAD